MQIVIESTDVTLELDGVPVRVWKGITVSGILCDVYVHRLSVHADQDCSEFESVLITTEMPVQIKKPASHV